MHAQKFFFRLQNKHNPIQQDLKLIMPTNDGYEIYTACVKVFLNKWIKQGFYQINLVASDPKISHLQADLFNDHNLYKMATNRVVDEINCRYGEFKIAPARLILRSDMPNVISPAWKPYGHRQTI